jgi:hypothetical protein
MNAPATLVLLGLLCGAAVGDESPKMPWKERLPVSIVVLDRETHRPIPRFSYTYTISTATEKYDPMLVRPIEVRAGDGTFSLLAPKVCKIGMRIEGENVLGGFGTWGEYHLTADNRQRRIEVLVATGVTVKGQVTDARNGKPIAGACVAPMIFTPPLFSPDRQRGVKTNAAGEFTLQGVAPSLGLGVSHPDYVDFNDGRCLEAGENLYAARIAMEPGDRLSGVVTDASGTPLAGVLVSVGGRNPVHTGKDGAFVLTSPSKRSGTNRYPLFVEKAGYLCQRFMVSSASRTGLRVVLQRPPLLVGQVVDPDGRPVANYRVSAGSSLEPGRWMCSSADTRGPEGRFSLAVPTDRDFGNRRKAWVGVKAPGFAFWDTTLDAWQGTHSITARLQPGVAVHGVVHATSGPGKVSVQLLPCRVDKELHGNGRSRRQELGSLETSLDDRGAFRFEHVAPGQYVLAIFGPGITPTSTSVAVAGSDLDAGAFCVQGRGSVCGLAYQDRTICEGDKCRLDPNRRPWAFAEGYISFTGAAGRSHADEFEHLKPIQFTTDERGRFRVDGVPAGTVSVEFNYSITADVIGAHARITKVLPGKTTEVRFFDTSHAWDFACRLVVGDGSPAQFASGTGMGARRKVENVTARPPMLLVELQPKQDVPTSFAAADWQELDVSGRILLSDVHPGAYRLTVGDWQGSRGLRDAFCETDVVVKPAATTPILALGGGCITGAIQPPRKPRFLIHVVAVGEKTHTIRHAHCDGQGNFCARYLPEDRYALVAHDNDAGWCRMPSVSVKNNITGLGAHKLVPGGTIAGRVPSAAATDPTVAVLVTDAEGIPIEPLDRHEPLGKDYTVSGLWPGRWTVTLRRAERVITQRSVELRGTETVACHLDGK